MRKQLVNRVLVVLLAGPREINFYRVARSGDFADAASRSLSTPLRNVLEHIDWSERHERIHGKMFAESWRNMGGPMDNCACMMREHHHHHYGRHQWRDVALPCAAECATGTSMDQWNLTIYGNINA